MKKLQLSKFKTMVLQAVLPPFELYLEILQTFIKFNVSKSLIFHSGLFFEFTSIDLSKECELKHWWSWWIWMRSKDKFQGAHQRSSSSAVGHRGWTRTGYKGGTEGEAVQWG